MCPLTHHSDAAVRLVRPGRTLQLGRSWRDRREQRVLKAEDILRQIESAGYQVAGGRDSIGDGQDGRATSHSLRTRGSKSSRILDVTLTLV